MLINFRFENYKSYKETQTFSMVAGSTRTHEERLEKTDKCNLVKFSAVYGANAGGKSNFVEALVVMQTLICVGLPNNGINCSYLLDNEYVNKPTFFEITLLLNNEVYTYGFGYNSLTNKYVSEWLNKVSATKTIEIFSRDIEKGEYTLNDKLFNGNKDKIKGYLDDLKTNNTKLFLSFINIDVNNLFVIEQLPVLNTIYNWFKSKLAITNADMMLTSGDYFVIDEKLKQLSNLLELFDTGIKSMNKIPVAPSIAVMMMPRSIVDNINSTANQIRNLHGDKGAATLFMLNKNLWDVRIDKDGNVTFNSICFFHDKEKKIPFNVAQESEGTIRIIELAEVLLTQDNDKFFVIDELDRKLHPQLTCKFVELFLEKSKTCNNQCVVTTHESRLMDFDILRRDEIWFANKNKDGESSLYSLEEFNVRFDKKIDKAYLDGRYGGVPIFDSVFPIEDICKK